MVYRSKASQQALRIEQAYDPTDSTQESHVLMPLGPPHASKSPHQRDSTRNMQLRTSWRDLWRTPVTMAVFFLLACLIFAVHLTLFIYLDKKSTDASNSIPQNYTATLSHLLGLLFRASLSASLVVAFTQYLWHVMRQKSIKISTLESLFKITHNPFLLAQGDVIKITPVLFALALFMWLLPLAVTFPPGALIVVSNAVHHTSSVNVPIYNATSMTGKSLEDAEPYFLSSRFLSGGAWNYAGATPGIRRLGRQTLELGDIVPVPSPCGPNCTYTIEFDGPYLKCNESVITEVHPMVGTMDCGYNAFTSSNLSTLPGPGSASRFLLSEPFQLSVSSSITQNPDGNLTQEVKTLSCSPSQAHYTVNVNYTNGLHAISRSEEYQGTLRDMLKYLTSYKPKNGVWEVDLLGTMAAYNHFALIEALMNPLGGNYTMLKNGEFYSGVGSPVSCGSVAGTLVADTNFNTQRDNFTRTPAQGPSFTLSQNLLNDALFNTTMNAALQLGFWTAPVVGNMSTFNQFYSFANPKTIILPYILCIVLSIPFLLLGLSSLRSNGVSAIDGGLMQIFMTSRGSETLEKAAASGCLGGEENVPEKFKNMEIRFGELVSSGTERDDDSGQVRRAGFGIEGEVVPLRRGVLYGS